MNMIGSVVKDSGYYRYCSPCGNLILSSSQCGLKMCDWEHRVDTSTLLESGIKTLSASTIGMCDVIQVAICQLDEYFLGRRQKFSLPIDWQELTQFRKSVYQNLIKLDYGSTMTYSDFAAKFYTSLHTRAVAAALANNKLNIIIPCHRVIHSSKGISAYRGGLDAKRYLLELEKTTVESDINFPSPCC